MRVYENANIARQLISKEFKGHSVIYQWTNLITGEVYVGSAVDVSSRILSYFSPSVLGKGLRIYKNIITYTHANFSVAILEDLGPKEMVTKKQLLAREQFYLDILFQSSPQMVLNSALLSNSTLGMK